MNIATTVTTATAISTPATNRRHRRDGTVPSGNSTGSSVACSQYGANVHPASQVATGTNGKSPGRASPSYAHSWLKAETATSPADNNTQAQRLPGSRTAIRAPASGNKQPTTRSPETSYP